MPLLITLLLPNWAAILMVTGWAFIFIRTRTVKAENLPCLHFGITIFVLETRTFSVQGIQLAGRRMELVPATGTKFPSGGIDSEKTRTLKLYLNTGGKNSGNRLSVKIQSIILSIRARMFWMKLRWEILKSSMYWTPMFGQTIILEVLMQTK